MADVVIVGAGPAGLSAAAALAGRGYAVRVLDRDEEPGGAPRHSNHPGYGARDFGRRHEGESAPLGERTRSRRIRSGPDYARELVDRAARAGAAIDVMSTVTSLDPASRSLEVTSPAGREVVTAGAIVLATGCREQPRSARLVPGSRPSGIYTTGWLQRLVHLGHGCPGSRAVVVGAEHVSFSAVVTLAESGCRTVAMVTEHSSHTSFAAFALAARARYRFPLITDASVIDIQGHDRVRGVTLRHSDGRLAHLDCDCVIFTGGWRAEDELAVASGLALAPGRSGPSHDAEFRTASPGVFLAGNVAHPGAPAETCADDGLRAAQSIDDWLATSTWPSASAPIEVAAPLLWCSPDRVVPGAAGRLRLLSSQARDLPRLVVRQGRRELWTGRIPLVRPTRPFSLPGDWAQLAHPDEAVTISFA